MVNLNRKVTNTINKLIQIEIDKKCYPNSLIIKKCYPNSLIDIRSNIPKQIFPFKNHSINIQKRTEFFFFFDHYNCESRDTIIVVETENSYLCFSVKKVLKSKICSGLIIATLQKL